MRGRIRTWSLWAALNVIIAGYLSYALFAPASTVKTALLPGETSHGHYQIEMDCNACHATQTDASGATSVDSAVMQDACIRCHGQQLKEARDTHPAKKFNDPVNAELLLTLNAQDCLACHREHVPEQTLTMGLTMPSDYCWHCHQEVADSRPSHQGMAYDSCATAGCHNYHDNSALYEKYLDDHWGEPDLLETALLPQRRSSIDLDQLVSLAEADANAPKDKLSDKQLLADWQETSHAAAGVNCSGCHQVAVDSEPKRSSEPSDQPWSDQVSMETCRSCHEREADAFITGKHGMRLAAGMSPMTPAMARQPMHTDASHRQLDCNACHAGHRFDTQFAAVDACLKCHADSHSMAYSDSSHAQLWRDELAGDLPAGSGVTCATCHMPRIVDGDDVHVHHDQSSNLRPNEKMVRQVCKHCHGLEFSLSALADFELMLSCYDGPPTERNESVEMAHDWFQEKQRKLEARKAKRNK
ncbi:MAG: cytochrome c3 family protein [Planctomycetota bacterium]